MKKKLFNYRFGFSQIEKILLVMRISCLLTFLCVFQVSAAVYSQNTLLDLELKNKTVREVLKTLEVKSNYRFFYNDDFTSLNKVLSINVHKKSIETILKEILSGDNVTYKFMADNAIVILPVSELQQKYKITGTVTDEATGVTLPGVSVMIQGTTKGTTTGADGKFTLNIPNTNAVLVFSFIGYLTEKVPVSGKSVIDVKLKTDVKNLDEVVVVGYGTMKKKLVTGATVQIKGEDMAKLNTVSPLTAMQNQSPGMEITQTSSKPGGDFKVNIRGIGSTGSSGPLVIIDDIVGGDLNLLNPSDIESIDILKDAASAAIYGARAANGVILVKTKKGKAGKLTFTYDGYYGLQNVAKYNEVSNAQQYMELENEEYTNSGSPIPNWATLVPNYSKDMAGTNWQKEFANKNAIVQNHSFGLTGGSEMSNYSLGFSYTDQNGIMGKPAAPVYDRYSLRMNSEHILYKNSSFDVVRIGENILYNYTIRQHDGLADNSYGSNDYHNMLSTNPLMSVYDANGNFTKTIPWYTTQANPIAIYYYQRSQNISKAHNLRTNAFIEIQPIKNLKFKSNFGYSLDAASGRNYIPAYYLNDRFSSVVDQINQSQYVETNYEIDNTISYKTKIGEHTIDALIGQSFEKSGIGEGISGQNKNSQFSSLDYAYLSNIATISAANTALSGWPFNIHTIASFFGRINYDYKETYLASVTLRADGSSNFASGKRWGKFPSFSAGWVISNESFMSSFKNVINYLKPRISWGQNGNESINPFQYSSTYAFGRYYYFGTDKTANTIGAYPSIIANKDVTWETSEQTNIGVDSKFFNSRLGFSFDWYKKTTKNWLVQAPVLATWGAPAPFINGGDIENKGVELALTWNDKIGDLTYGINANMAFNKNKVTRIANEEGIIEGSKGIIQSSMDVIYRTQVGYPIGYFYGYKTAGVFQNQAQIDAYKGAKIGNPKPGDLIFVDTNHDGIIDQTDRTQIGDPNPHMMLGLSFNLGYKGFDFSVSANGRFGNQIASSFRANDDSYENFSTHLYDGRWHGDGTSNRYPRLTLESLPNYGYFSDIYIEPGDFVRIQNVTLGYDFKKLFPNMFLGQARFYLSVQNLYTFTKYYGADPEVGYAAENWASGVDVGAYPKAMTIMMGINLKF